MRKIGIAEIEDIALGAALLGAGGGGDPYVGKLVAIGAVKECGPVTLLDPEEVPDDALVVPIAMMGAPTVLSEKAIGGAEYQTLYDTVSTFYGKPIYASHCSGGPARASAGGLRRHGTGFPGASDGDLYHRGRLCHAYGSCR